MSVVDTLFFVLYVNRSKWVSFVCQAMLKRKMSFNFRAQHAIQAIFWRWKHEDTCASSFSFPQLKLFYQSQEFLCVELHTTKGKKTQLHNCLFCFVFFRLNKVFMITRFQIGYFFLFEIVDCTQVSMKLNLELSKLMIFLNALVRVVLMGACKTPLSQNARILHHLEFLRCPTIAVTPLTRSLTNSHRIPFMTKMRMSSLSRSDCCCSGSIAFS